MTSEAQNSLASSLRGQRVRVLEVRGDDALARRLVDHGLWRGTLVELLTSAPLGDPMLFSLRGYRLALRREEAARVMVEPASREP
ncbi:MAG: hypothetical protein Fur0037_08980 [Planctomycetota bacterium]